MKEVYQQNLYICWLKNKDTSQIRSSLNNRWKIARKQWTCEHRVPGGCSHHGLTKDGCWLPWPSPTGAYILLRLRHARHCRPVRLHPRLPSTHNPPLLPGFLSLPLPPRTQEGCKVTATPLPRPSQRIDQPPPPRLPPPRRVQGGGTAGSTVGRATHNHPQVGFPTQASHQPQPSLSLWKVLGAVTRASSVRADAAEGKRG